MQQVKAGLKAIYLSGWQVAADANIAGEMYPDQSLYPAEQRAPRWSRASTRPCSAPTRSTTLKGERACDWFAPIVADAEAGFGGPLNAFELMKAMIEAGAAGVHFEDQLASEKKCGHLGGKVLVPTWQFIRTLNAARLAADVSGVPTLLVARTDANSAQLLTSDIDDATAPSSPASARPKASSACAGRRRRAWPSRAASPMRPMPTCCGGRPRTPTSTRRARSPRRSTPSFPGKLLAYNCSPSFNWRDKLDARGIAGFQRELAALGYKFQFVTLAGFHALNYAMFELARGYRDRGMAAYSRAAAGRSSRPRRTATPPPGTSARSAPAISTRSPRASLAAAALDHGAGGLHRDRAVQGRQGASRRRGVTKSRRFRDAKSAARAFYE